MKNTLVIGIGNRFRGDDAIGLEVTQGLEKSLGVLADFAYCDGDTLALMELWQGRDCVFLIDAVLSGEKEVGYLHRYLAHKDQIPALFSRCSTHLIDIAQAIELAKTLEKMPRELVLYGIEGANFRFEEGLSSVLKAKLPEIAKTIEKEVRGR